MDFENRFLDPDDPDPLCCEDCPAEREDCGPDCELMKEFFRQQAENIAKMEKEADREPRNEDWFLDQQWEREI